MRTPTLLVLISLLPGAACTKDEGAAVRARALRTEAPSPRFSSTARLVERRGQGRLAYLGLDVAPEAPSPGATVEVTHYFRVERPPSADYDVFVHGEGPSGARWLIADHAPVFGRAPTSGWKKGEIWADQHRVKIPDEARGTLLFRVGLFKGDERWIVEAPPGKNDGRDRLEAGRIKLAGLAVDDDLPAVLIPLTTATITPDGQLNEPAWSTAPVLSFANSMGGTVRPRFPTELRLLYDANNLYVGFQSVDEDITERFSKRDDPIYDHETVEVFIMPNVRAPDLGPYVELQASPGGVIFDASFIGRRRGMNTAWNAAQTVGTRIDGDLNGPGKDRGWASEWTVPWKSLRGVKAAPKAGDEWRMNAFRIEKYREGGQQKGEFTAWSPPMVGDFHNVVRFGRMKFGK